MLADSPSRWAVCIGPVGPKSDLLVPQFGEIKMEVAKYSFVSEKSCRSHRAEDGREIWTVTVPVSELPTELKLGPNARYARLTNKPARAMLETLRNDPESFVFKNNGIMIVADSISVDGNRVTITCKEAGQDEDSPGHGVL